MRFLPKLREFGDLWLVSDKLKLTGCNVSAFFVRKSCGIDREKHFTFAVLFHCMVSSSFCQSNLSNYSSLLPLSIVAQWKREKQLCMNFYSQYFF